MFTLKTSRKLLLELLANKRLVNNHNINHSIDFPKNAPHQDEMYLIWEEDPNVNDILPSAIIVNDQYIKEFYAWTSTFISTYRPFSAYIRVIPFSSVSNYSSMLIKPILKNSTDVCAGVILAEALSNLPEKMSKQALNPLTCTSTYSYCMARGLGLGLPFQELYNVSQKQSSVRKLTSQPPRKLDANSIILVWYVICNLFANTSNDKRPSFSVNTDIVNKLVNQYNNANLVKYSIEYISEACMEYKLSGEISNRLISKLTDFKIETTSIKAEMNETRERRVVCFNNIVNSSEFINIDSNIIQSFLVGYFASLLNPGSLVYVDLVTQQLNKYPMALLWYGLFAGLNVDNDVLACFDGLGRRIIRDILAPSNIFDQPQADISIEELDVFFTGDNKLLNFRRGYPNHIEIELAPCIKTSARWYDSEKPVPQNTSNDYYKHETPEELFDAFDRQLKGMEDIQRKLRAVYVTQNSKNRDSSKNYPKSERSKKVYKDNKQDKLL